MEEILEYLLENESLSLYNEENQRKITISMEEEDSWDIFVDGDRSTPIKTTNNINTAIDFFEETSY